jgi:hypothetical protein
MKIIGTVSLIALAIVVATLLDAVTQDANAMAPGSPGGYTSWAARRANRPTTHPTTHPNHYHMKKH